MSECNRRRVCSCSCLSIVLSIIIGAIVAILFAFDLIQFLEVIIWITFGLSVLALIILYYVAVIAAREQSSPLIRCLCRNILCLIISAFGTLILSIVGLSIILVPELIASIIIVALLFFFFALLLISLIAFLLCLLFSLCCD
ncbi:MAG: hypothetical protein A2Y17_02985 [Clostridiales bacterium GWF2_38_85]|nr:MAG: hypothetical protein A2Y17_02985 [Clostridiales bacterium GWF2_38_85]